MNTTSPLKMLVLLFAGLILIPNGAFSATFSAADTTIASNDLANTDQSGSIGRNNANNQTRRGFAVFSVQDILANESLVLGDLATTEFSYSFITDTVFQLDGVPSGPGSYKIGYMGFFANSNFPDNAGVFSGGGRTDDWDNKFADYSSTVLGTAAEIDTGIADNNLIGQSISASGFFLTGVTEADSANDVVLFGIRYDETQSDNLSQDISGHTLTAIPEPSSVVLLALGFVVLAWSRRKNN